MATAQSVQEQCYRWLSETFNGVNVNPDNGWIIIPGVGSTAVAVVVSEVLDGEHLKVRVIAPLLTDVQINDPLLRYIALEGGTFHFGYLRLMHDEGGSMADLGFEYSLLGDELDRVELETACRMVGGTADNLDNQLQRQFGGRLFSQT